MKERKKPTKSFITRSIEEIEKEAFKKGYEAGKQEMIEKACEYAQSKYDLDYCANVKDVLNYLKSIIED